MGWVGRLFYRGCWPCHCAGRVKKRLLRRPTHAVPAAFELVPGDGCAEISRYPFQPAPLQCSVIPLHPFSLPYFSITDVPVGSSCIEGTPKLGRLRYIFCRCEGYFQFLLRPRLGPLPLSPLLADMLSKLVEWELTKRRRG